MGRDAEPEVIVQEVPVYEPLPADLTRDLPVRPPRPDGNIAASVNELIAGYESIIRVGNDRFLRIRRLEACRERLIAGEVETC